MKDYHINIFYSDEDEGYIADIPDLESCSAFGETPEAALAELEKAKDAWLEVARELGKSRSRRPRIARPFIRQFREKVCRAN
jgi:predicted RNase H-like HicB family nuclease